MNSSGCPGYLLPGFGGARLFHLEKLGEWGNLASCATDLTNDKPRPGAPRSITDEDVEKVVTTTLESMQARHTLEYTPDGEADGLSQTAIVRIWGAFGLQPHRVEGLKLSKDP